MNDAGFVNVERDRWIRLKPALILLRDARSYAKRTRQDVWQFATELEELQAQGLTTTDLRWLVSTNTVAHAVECTSLQSPERTFSAPDNLSFFSRSCFVLSDHGLESIGKGSVLANQELSERKPVSQVRTQARTNQPQFQNQNRFSNGTSRTQAMNKMERFDNKRTMPVTTNRLQPGAGVQTTVREETERTMVKPHWDISKRELCFDGQTIKRFKWPAANQELVLRSFEELGWPSSISDPLPPSENVDSKARLHDTIKCLNRHLKNAPFRFHGNGNGKGVIWRLA